MPPALVRIKRRQRTNLAYSSTMMNKIFRLVILTTFLLFAALEGNNCGVSALKVSVDRSVSSSSKQRAGAVVSVQKECSNDGSIEDGNDSCSSSRSSQASSSIEEIELLSSPHSDALQDAYTFCPMHAVMDERCVELLYTSLTKEFHTHATSPTTTTPHPPPLRNVLIVVARVDDEAVFGASIMASDLLSTQYTIVVATGGSNAGLRQALKRSVDAARPFFVHPIRVVHLPCAECPSCVPFVNVRDDRYFSNAADHHHHSKKQQGGAENSSNNNNNGGSGGGDDSIFNIDGKYHFVSLYKSFASLLNVSLSPSFSFSPLSLFTFFLFSC
jgi:hypothetical protein